MRIATWRALSGMDSFVERSLEEKSKKGNGTEQCPAWNPVSLCAQAPTATLTADCCLPQSPRCPFSLTGRSDWGASARLPSNSLCYGDSYFRFPSRAELTSPCVSRLSVRIYKQ